jgi:fumarate reductase subunit D
LCWELDVLRRQPEPFLWLLFSAGGVFAALVLPIFLLLFAVAFPLGWLRPPSHEDLSALLGSPITRLVLLAVCALSLAHWAHRFRYTLYDGLQIKHLNELINPFCYGGALVGTLVAAWLLFVA